MASQLLQRQTTPSRTTGSSRSRVLPTESTTGAETTSSNEDRIAEINEPVNNVLEQLFCRILGKSPDTTDLATASFEKSQLKDYLDDQLGLAEREMFRAAKIGGVATKMIAALDADGDGRVSWTDFQSSLDQLRSHLGVPDQVDSGLVGSSAGEKFDQISGGESSIGMDALQTNISTSMDPETSHLDLVAQLAARLAIDLADQDERDLPVAERSLSREEWVSAAQDLAQS